jgi:DNA-binding SARP family transcriptional activator/Tol biopolymer transport system component
MLVLELLGTLSLRSETRPVPVSAQQKRSLGLLAILGLGGRQGVSRDKIEAFLWPESSGELASHSLDQTVYTIRHALGRDLLLSTGRELRLNPELVQVDVWEFEQAIRDRDRTPAAGIYKGTLLEGFNAADSGELESWIDTNRTRLRLEYQTAIESLAKVSADAGDHSQSLTWWRALANSDPLSPGATKKLMLALAAAGDRAGAVKQARLYQQLVRQQLEIEPDSEIESLAATLSHPAITETASSGAAERAPQDRSASASDFADTPNNPSSTPFAATGIAKGKDSRRRERTVLYAVIALAILMSGAAILGWMRPATSKSVVRYTLVVDSTEAIAKGPSWSGRMALSPDGSRLAYIGGSRSQLLIRPRNQLRATAVPGTEGVTTPFFSPDGSQVGFLVENKVQIAPFDMRTPPITVTDTLTGVTGASWGPDGFIYADASGPLGLVRVEARPGAKPRWFTVLDTASGEFDHTWPDVLPNGKGVLFTDALRGKTGAKGRNSYAIAVADIPSGKHRVVVDDAMYARYATSGHLLYVTTNKTLMVVPFDQNSMKITGEPTALTEGMRLGLFGSADLAVSATGTLVYATGAGQGQWEVVWVTRDGKTLPVDPDWQGGYFAFPALSPDGKWLAVARSATTEFINLWIKRLDRGPSIKLTLEGRWNVGPAWTPDGRSVTFSSNAGSGAFQLWTRRADGSAPAALQFREKRHVYGPRWSPDGKWLIFHTDPAQSGAGDILGIRPEIDSVPVALVASGFTELSPALSPDGRWLAYVSNETGEDKIYVVPFPKTGAAKWAISTSGGTEPLWSHRGSELFYRDAAENLVAVEVRTKPAFSVGRSTSLFPAGGFYSYRFAPQYAVGPGDRRFLMIRPAEPNTPDKLIVVENWFEELKAKPRK